MRVKIIEHTFWISISLVSLAWLKHLNIIDQNKVLFFSLLIFLYIICHLFMWYRAYCVEKHIKSALHDCDWPKLQEACRQVDVLNQICALADKCMQQSKAQELTRTNNRQLQINLLQNQINPHFLYNTLEAIRGQALIEKNNEIAHMVEALGAFFRYNINQKDLIVTLRDELKNVNNYFMIQDYRFEGKFKLEISLAENDEELMNCYLPKLTLQPIVENALTHGLEFQGKNGCVKINIVRTEKRLIITISDNGIGMNEQALVQLRTQIRGETVENGNIKKNRIALSNINRRIKLIYGEDFGMEIYSIEDCGTDVVITLPLIWEKWAISDELAKES